MLCSSLERNLAVISCWMPSHIARYPLLQRESSVILILLTLSACRQIYPQGHLEWTSSTPEGYGNIHTIHNSMG